MITLTREEAQQVLDTLNKAISFKESDTLWSLEFLQSVMRLGNDLRARLSAPEPEPVACIVKDCENHKHQGRFVGDICSPCHAFITRNEGKYSQAYRNAQREWQGLTDEEIHNTGGYREDRELYWFARTIEAKLKEKNT
jgi:hypothetical protein